MRSSSVISFSSCETLLFNADCYIGSGCFVKNGGVLDFPYTRRKTAPGEFTFSVEWSDTLTIPAGPKGRRFVQLKVTADA